MTLVVRGERSLVPDANTRMAVGDGLLVVATAQTRSAAERRLREVSRGGRLAGWQPADAAAARERRSRRRG